MSQYPVVCTVAGAGRRGFVDGHRLTSAFIDAPQEICHLWDALFVFVDSHNNCLRTLDLSGGRVHTLPTQAFLHPRSPLLIDGGAAIVCADSGHNKIRMLQLTRGNDGGVSEIKDCNIAGTGRVGCMDGPAESATFNGPCGLAILPDGSIVVADSGNHAIRRVAARPGQAGLFVSTLVGGGSDGPGFTDGDSRFARLRGPSALAVDPHSGTIFITDEGNHAVRALHPPAEGSSSSFGWILTTLVVGALGGKAGCVTLREPNALATSREGTLLISDSQSSCIWSLGEDFVNNATIHDSGSTEGPANVSQVLLCTVEGGGVAVPLGLSSGDGASLGLMSTGAGALAVLPRSILPPNLLSSSTTQSRQKQKAPPSLIEDLLASATGSHLVSSLPWDALPQFTSSSPTNPSYALHGAPAAILAVHSRFKCLSAVTGGGSSGTSNQRYSDGLHNEARFRKPSGLCVCEEGAPLYGSVLVSDSGNSYIRMLVSGEGLAYSLTGKSPSSPNSTLKNSSLLTQLLPSDLFTRGLECLANLAPTLDTRKNAFDSGEHQLSLERTVEDKKSERINTASLPAALNHSSSYQSGDPTGPSPVTSPKSVGGVDSFVAPNSSFFNAPTFHSATRATIAATTLPTFSLPTATSVRTAGASRTGLGSPPSAVSRAALEGSFSPNSLQASVEQEALRRILESSGPAGATAGNKMKNSGGTTTAAGGSSSGASRVLSGSGSFAAGSSSSKISSFGGKGLAKSGEGPSNGTPVSHLLHSFSANPRVPSSALRVDSLAASLLAAASLASPMHISRAEGPIRESGRSSMVNGLTALDSNPSSLLAASTRLIREAQAQASLEHPSPTTAKNRQNSALVGVVIGDSNCIARRMLEIPNVGPVRDSRDEVAAGEYDQAGALIRALLVGGSSGIEKGEVVGNSKINGGNDNNKAPFLSASPPPLVLAALSAQSHNFSGSFHSVTTTAPPTLINARFTRHTSASLQHQRAKGNLVLRTAPAFVNVASVLEKKMNDIRKNFPTPQPSASLNRHRREQLLPQSTFLPSSTPSSPPPTLPRPQRHILHAPPLGSPSAPTLPPKLVTGSVRSTFLDGVPSLPPTGTKPGSISVPTNSLLMKLAYDDIY